MTDEQYSCLIEQFNKITEEIFAFDNLVEDCLDDRKKYLEFDDLFEEVVSQLGNMADLLDLDVEL